VTSLLQEKPVEPELLGAQEPRLAAWPAEAASSAGQEAIELSAVAGLDLDPWQQLVLRQALGERADGRWAAFQVGLVVPRQNGKGSVLEARELAGLFLFGERLIIHSAHEQTTATEHFHRLLNLIEGVPEFSSRMLRPSRGKGAEEIRLRDGGRIKFKTRTGGGGRGLTGDLVVLDEAMILPVATTAALVPVMAARSLDGNPQLWYAGSAVDRLNHEHGVVLARLRQNALAGTPRIAYAEWSAEGDDPSAVPTALLADREVWARSNPGLGIRISAGHVADEMSALGAREFAVERLGIGDWPDPDVDSDQVIDLDDWKACVDTQSEPVGPVCFAFDVRPDRSASAIAVAGSRQDGQPHIEITQDAQREVDHRPGTGWLVDRIVGLADKHDHVAVICDGASPAASFVDALRAHDITVETFTMSEYGQACGSFVDAVEQHRLRHLDTPELNAAVRAASKRSLGDAFAWSRKGSRGDISPLVACTLALRGLETHHSPAPFVEVFG
jgi:hypothetical protein